MTGPYFKKGFTLLEILLAVAAMAILAGIVIVALNPGKQLAAARNAKRQSDVAALASALYQYSTDHDGALPTAVDTSTHMIGTAASGCAVMCGAIPAANVGGGAAGGADTPYSATDSDSSVFNKGVYTNTWFSTTNNAIELVNPIAAPSGSYLSAVKDSGSSQTSWSSFSWLPAFPTNKALPDFGQSESGYPSGNVSMASSILLMHFDDQVGATSFTDTSGNNNNGTCGASCPTLGTSGLFGTAAIFDGLKTAIYTPDTAALEYTGGNITLGAWIYLNGTEISGGNIFSKPWNGGGQYNYILGYTNNRVLVLDLFGATGYRLLAPPTAVIPQNTWAYVASTIDSTGLVKLYINGARVATGTSTISSWVPTYGNLKLNLVIGGIYPYGSNWTGNTAMILDGKIDEAAIYTRTLSAGEILDRYKRGGELLRLQVKSCGDSVCSSGTFVGPDGTANTYFTDSSNSSSLTPPGVATLSGIPKNKYFQYKVLLDAGGSIYSPGLKQTTVAGSFPPAASGASSGVSAANIITDSGATAFNQGTYVGTVFNIPNNSTELSNPANAQSGTFTSAIRDSASTQSSWVNISWIPESPTMKEFPNNGQSETGYLSGNANMSGNTGLWHLNEQPGATAFADSSGSGNMGTCTGTGCPTMNSTAAFNNAAWFTKSLQKSILVPNSTSLNTGSGDFTISMFLNLPSLPFGNYNILSKGGGIFNSGGVGWQFRINGTTGLEFCVAGGSGACQRLGYNLVNALNKWTLITVVVSRTTHIASLYVNGQPATTSAAPNFTDIYNLQIGNGYDSYFTGGLDEISFWNRTLSQQEILDLYRRSQYNVRLQVRSCSDATCSVNPTFVGPDGTSGSYFSDANNQSVTTPTQIPLVGVASNEYIQYKAFLDTNNTGLTPGLASVSLGYDPQGGATTATSTNTGTPVSGGPIPTVDACIDLSSSLVSDYITDLPIDPKYGSAAKTYYAVGKDDKGVIMITACGSENGVLVQTKI